MAKEPTDVATQVTVEHLATMDASPSVANVLVSGTRVGYVFYDRDCTVQLLPKNNTGVRLTAEQGKAVVAKAQELARPLAEAEAKERAALKELGL